MLICIFFFEFKSFKIFLIELAKLEFPRSYNSLFLLMNCKYLTVSGERLERNAVTVFQIPEIFHWLHL